jgi:rubredoxin
MLKWTCPVCDYVYEPEEGDETQDVPPDTPFFDLPEDWTCPECGTSKEDFERFVEES